MTQVRKAAPADLPAIARLANAAYRELGGWTTEHGVVFGDRVGEADLRADLTDPAKSILCAVDGEEVVGCVRPERDGETLFIGLLAVWPNLQAKGVGRSLLEASEAHGVQIGAKVAELSVISTRAELIAWYERRGYRLTGETAPFVYDQLPPDVAQTPGLEFVILQKPL